MKKNSLVIYTEWLDMLDAVPEGEGAQLLLELMRYVKTGEAPTFANPYLSALFNVMKIRVDKDGDKYADRCKKSKAAGKLGGLKKAENLAKLANGSECYKKVANVAKVSECYNDVAKLSEVKQNLANVADNDNDNDNDILKKESKEKKTNIAQRFCPPSLKEVKDFISEMHYQVDADRFIAFYESKNWMVGVSKMKNWKAAVRTWHLRDAKAPSPQPRQATRINYIDNIAAEWQQ